MKAGWKTKNLGDLCHVIGGGTPSKDKPEYYSGEIAWATVRDMRSDVITDTECKITKEAVKASSTNIIPGGNVVIATRVGLGKVCLLGQDTAINQDLRGIVPINSKVLSVQFLYWWLKYSADVIVAEGTGATVQGHPDKPEGVQELLSLGVFPRSSVSINLLYDEHPAWTHVRDRLKMIAQ